MNDDDRELAALAGEPLDDADAATVQQLRRLYVELDPVPAGLLDRVTFSLALDEMFDEVAELVRVPLDALAVRGDDVAMRTETLTFSADPLNALVTVTRVAAGSVRLDGWLTPPVACTVRLRVQEGGDVEAGANAEGRFSFEDVPEGLGQLSFAVTGEGTTRTVVTPVFEL